MSVKEINLLSKINQYQNPIKTGRIKPKILVRHKKIIEHILKPKEDRKISDKISSIQLELFSDNLN